MPEITIDTSDTHLVGKIAMALLPFVDDGQGTNATHAVLEALAPDPAEPAEPPPSVYRDQDGSVWYGAEDRMWRQDACNSWLLWHVARELVSFPLVPLWTAAELIPDPDDAAAVKELWKDCPTPALASWAVTEVLRVLRARAESRVPTGGTGDGP